MTDKETPLVSVFVIAYNHEKYIAQCLDSILGQKTDFTFRIELGEDCSPDNTRAICKEYAAKYPDKVNLLPADKNIGAIRNGIRTFRACTGKYIAMCEGDDYWCDPEKLQKQVDFLEANPGFSMCFSSVYIEDDTGLNLPYEHYYRQPYKTVYTIEDFILSDKNIVPTPSVIFRNVLPDPYPGFFINSMVGDTPVQLFAADKGKALFMQQKLAVYRDHAGGVTKSEMNIRRGEAELLKLLHAFNEYFGYRYNTTFRQRFHETAKSNLMFGSRGLKGMAKLRNYLKWFPQYIKYASRINWREVLYYHIVLFAPWMLRGKKSSAS